MARSRKPAAGTDPRPIVTYSHMPTDIAGGRTEPRGLDPDATIIDAVEVPLVADAEAGRRPRRAPDLRATDHAAPDLRADIRDDSFEPDEAIAAAAFEPEPRRRRGGRLLFFVALIAIAGGAGALASAFGVFAPPKVAAVATPSDPAAELIAIHKQIDALGDASTPQAQVELAKLTKRLAELEQSGALVNAAPASSADEASSGDVGPTVRKISLSPEDGAAEPAAPPPSPRLRPEKVAPAVAAIPPADDSAPVAEPLMSAPAKNGSPKVVRGAPPRPLAPPAGDDNFIASVEKALADSKGDRPEPAPLPMGAAAPAAPPAAAPPPVAAIGPAGDGPVALTPPPPPAAALALPKLDGDAADPYALPVPITPMANTEARPKLPPGVKLPPADIPNVAPSDQQY